LCLFWSSRKRDKASASELSPRTKWLASLPPRKSDAVALIPICFGGIPISRHARTSRATFYEAIYLRRTIEIRTANLFSESNWMSVGLSRHSLLQDFSGCKLQPCWAADPEPLGGGVDAGKHLSIEAQGDHGRARVVVESGPHGGWWRDALGWPRRSILIRSHGPVFDEREELWEAPAHLA
jgi:hypothetical protein